MKALAVAAALAIGVGPTASAPKPRPLAASIPQSGAFTITVSPATVTFTATNPGTVPVVAANATTTVTWQILSGGKNWTLRVKAGSPSFANCPTIPISAVTVSCASAKVASVGGSGSCAGPFRLGTGQSQVAAGAEGMLAFNYTVTINFTLADSWKYIAETNPACSLALTYTADVP